MAHRLSASEVALATRPSWTPDMPQMKAYKQRMHARLLQEGEQQKFPRSKAVADVALQPDQAATPQLVAPLLASTLQQLAQMTPVQQLT